MVTKPLCVELGHGIHCCTPMSTPFRKNRHFISKIPWSFPWPIGTRLVGRFSTTVPNTYRPFRGFTMVPSSTPTPHHGIIVLDLSYHDALAQRLRMLIGTFVKILPSNQGVPCPVPAFGLRISYASFLANLNSWTLTFTLYVNLVFDLSHVSN